MLQVPGKGEPWETAIVTPFTCILLALACLLGAMLSIGIHAPLNIPYQQVDLLYLLPSITYTLNSFQNHGKTLKWLIKVIQVGGNVFNTRTRHL